MITREEPMNIDFGLAVTFNGKSYTLLSPDNVQEYGIGGLICEYCRLHPTEIKDIILSCPGLDAVTTPDSIIETYSFFHDKLFEAFPPVIATMVSLEFQNGLSDWSKAMREDRVGEYIESCFEKHEEDKVKDYIFEGTPYEDAGCSTVLHTMLSTYWGFATTYVNTKFMFNQIIGVYGDDDGRRNQVIDVYSEMYGDLIDMQHIDYRIISTEKGMEDLFTIKSSISLLLFEMAHAIQAEIAFIKCANCDNVFVPEGRSDAIYCSYPSPQNKEKSCREIGAQIARANKEKNDVITREYRKAYMRHQMMVKRHPYDHEKRKAFESLTEGMKMWRKDLSDGTATTAGFLEWLEQFK